MTNNLIFLILMRRNMIPLDIQLTYTNIVFVDLLRESFKYMKYWHFLYMYNVMYCTHKGWFSSLKYISKYRLLEKSV